MLALQVKKWKKQNKKQTLPILGAFVSFPSFGPVRVGGNGIQDSGKLPLDYHSISSHSLLDIILFGKFFKFNDWTIGKTLWPDAESNINKNLHCHPCTGFNLAQLASLVNLG